MIFDTHTHYDDEAFDADREELLNGFERSGTFTLVNVGASMEGSRQSIAFTRKYGNFYATVGLHPDYAEDFTGENRAESCTAFPIRRRWQSSFWIWDFTSESAVHLRLKTHENCRKWYKCAQRTGL